MSHVFIDACWRRPVPYTPIWIMRQAGRYLPEYNATKAKTTSFRALCQNPELAAEVTLQPVDIIGVDAAILFSDILVAVEAIGIPYEVHPGIGPVIETPKDGLIESISVPRDIADTLSYVFSAIKLVKKQLAGRVPLIGFSGLPFTLATYILEGRSSKDFWATKRCMYGEPKVFAALMEILTKTVIAYAREQVHAGVEALQLFDTWASLLSPQDYRQYVLPYTMRVASAVADLGVPVIHYVNGVMHLLDDVASLPVNVLSIDWRCDLSLAKARVGQNKALQGNLDPFALYLSETELEARVRGILDVFGGDPGHIFNFGHGIFPQAPVERVKALVHMVHELSRIPTGR